MGELLWSEARARLPEELRLLPSSVGMQHEQQHQELLLMDVKHVLAQKPAASRLSSAGRCVTRREVLAPRASTRAHGVAVVRGRTGGGREPLASRPTPAGCTGEPCRVRRTTTSDLATRVLLQPFELASRPVTAGEYLSVPGRRTATGAPSCGWRTDGTANATRRLARAALLGRATDDDVASS